MPESEAVSPHHYAALTDTGLARSHNEDFAFAGPVKGAPEWLLLIVADGVGGHVGGQWASRRATELVSETLGQRLNAESADRGQILASVLEDANLTLYAEGRRRGSEAGGATTMVAALIRDGQAWWANIGDSRLYLIEAASARQVSADHSWVADQVRSGLMTEQQAENSPRRNIITRSIGYEPAVIADSGGPIALAPGDALLLCSDGVHGQVPAATIASIVRTHTPASAVQRLIELGNEAGGPDNLTAVVYCAPGGPERQEVTLKQRFPIDHGDADQPRKFRLLSRGAFVVAGVALVIAAAAIVRQLA